MASSLFKSAASSLMQLKSNPALPAPVAAPTIEIFCMCASVNLPYVHSFKRVRGRLVLSETRKLKDDPAKAKGEFRRNSIKIDGRELEEVEMICPYCFEEGLFHCLQCGQTLCSSTMNGDLFECVCGLTGRIRPMESIDMQAQTSSRIGSSGRSRGRTGESDQLRLTDGRR